jgi:hypothetical protein
MKTPRLAPVILLRIAAPIFAAVALASFVWYSQVRAQRSVPVAPQAENNPPVPVKIPVVISQSKSFPGPVVKGNDTLMLGSKSGLVDLAPSSSSLVITEGSSLQIDLHGNLTVQAPPAPTPAVKAPPANQEHPAQAPAQTKKRMLMPGSKAAPRLFSTEDQQSR